MSVRSFLASVEQDPCVHRFLQRLLASRVSSPDAFAHVRTRQLVADDFQRAQVGPGFESARRTAVLAYRGTLDPPPVRPDDLPDPLDFGLSGDNPLDTTFILSGGVEAAMELDTLALGADDGRWSLLAPYRRGPFPRKLLMSPYWVLLREEETGDLYRLDLLFSRTFFPSRGDASSRFLVNMIFWRDRETVSIPYLRREPAHVAGPTHLDLLEFSFSENRVTYFEGPEIETPGVYDTPELDLSLLTDCLIAGEE